jgi:hypothetical protein
VVIFAPARFGNILLSDPGPQNERLLDSFRLPNGELVGVISRTLDMTEEASVPIRAAVEQCLPESKTAAAPAPGVFPPRAIIYLEHMDGGEGLVDVAIPCTV